ncbi:TSUP family transporter [Jiangella alkaliphila]|uniref:TSUP family transporter n=1 Tax=Jiangella alkaliphila TaxID=419479 RepID=UPI001E468428
MLLAPTGYALLRPRSRAAPGPVARWVAGHQSLAAFVVGCVGGVYGIGGGSILSPLLVAGGLSVAVVAPSALACTWVTSVIGALGFVALSLVASGAVAPAWGIGLACGAGGLAGGYLGAALQPRIPEGILRQALGVAAVGIAAAYAVQVFS